MAFAKPYAPNWVSAGGLVVTCGNVVFPQARFNHSAEIPHCVLNPPAESAERNKKFNVSPKKNLFFLWFLIMTISL
jgi:hypothetical protein